MTKVFIDGSAGTTGLRIVERLSERKDLSLLILPEETRKDPKARADAINSSDIAFFCLPDDAAKEAASMVTNPDTVIIDTSTAHRTNDEWTYGFAEVKGLKEKIKTSKKIANPGCYASGFISLIAPLVENNLLKADAYISAYGISGYSGGGKKMIAQYEEENKDPLLMAPRAYALTSNHKHLPEMKKICGLENTPAFSPIVAPYYSGMEVCITLFEKDLNANKAQIEELFEQYYNGGLVSYVKDADEGGFTSAALMSGKDTMQIGVFGNDERVLLISRFDNLGKGASGAAIQNMNISLGLDEASGLSL